MGQVLEITGDNFTNEVLNSDIPVLIDFWAPWCGPCRMIAPIVTEIGAEYDGKLKVVKLNVDENGPIAQNYGIRSIPTLLVIKKGDVVEQIIGAVSKSALVDKLSKHI
jgi:thioredoxin 1